MGKQLKTVYSVGGLGNQLFVWAFALWLQEHTRSNVQLSSAFIRQNSGQHNSFASAIPFTSRQLKQTDSKIWALFARLGIRIARGVAEDPLKPAVSRLMRLTKFNEVGFCGDYQFQSDKNGHQYLGYFQTFRYLDDLGLSPNDFLAGIEIAQREILETDLAIHLRHGDYRVQGETFGVLPLEYYIAGVQLQKRHAPVNRIKVFGLFDDESTVLINGLQSAFPDISFDLECMSNPQPPQTELKMLAQFARQIISNSSYSWWSCWLAPQGLKVAPAEWFRGMPDPTDLLPATWKRVPFSWQD